MSRLTQLTEVNLRTGKEVKRRKAIFWPVHVSRPGIQSKKGLRKILTSAVLSGKVTIDVARKTNVFTTSELKALSRVIENLRK